MRYKIREMREKRHLSQEELAQISGVSRGIVVRLESDTEYETQVSTLEKIANALGVSIKSLFMP